MMMKMTLLVSPVSLSFLLVLLVLLVLQSGCSMPTATYTDSAFKEDRLSGKLLSIRIQQFENTRFSGLIGIRQTENGLRYGLLDATGVKLLEAETTPAGRHNPDLATGPLKDSTLAAFLSAALARIYFQEPATKPCDGSWFYRLCHLENEDHSWTKYRRNGPFTIWMIERRHLTGEAAETILYHQPWPGIKIVLEETSAAKNE